MSEPVAGEAPQEGRPEQLAGPPLRAHQELALAALERAWAEGRTRAWVALPPGAGKTRVGLEAIHRRLAEEGITRAVVLGPNTAIQAQWVVQAAAAGFDSSVDKSLAAEVTALTYQSVAVFDVDAHDEDANDEHGEAVAPGEPEENEEDAEPRVPGGRLVDRLHDNGRALLAALRGAGPMLLVLDECHHLLEVWGRLLGELLEELPQAEVLGLTATPPEALTAEQVELVDTLFGTPVFEVSIPAVVREGDLAPFAELAWLTTPTPTEADYLDEEAERFRELVTALSDPAFGTLPFLQWLDRRFVSATVPWVTIARLNPDLCRAALRLHHVGLLGLPPGARPTEEHRAAPTADDWVILVEDWLTRHPDEQAEAVVRRVLPSVGYQWTTRGIRRGRSPADRVLARSESKAHATVQIAAHEAGDLGDRMRMLVLCDHERAGATLPRGLEGVLDEQSGSARAVLAALLADPATRALSPLLVTGRNVAGAPDTLAALRETITDDPALRASLQVLPFPPLADGLSRLAGPWHSPTWVRHVTRFFQDGRCRVLVGTRALLGEGWDAPRITGVVDLTAATTVTSVVQTRGRALRLDPAWPDKVAVSWTVTCVAPDHPRGANDWSRLVRKHQGFYGVDDDGAVVDGVAHLDTLFSPYAPPDAGGFDAVNARMLVRSEDRAGIRERWRVGQAYEDAVAPTVRLVTRDGRADPPSLVPARVVVHDGVLVDREPDRPSPLVPSLLGLLAVALLLGALVVPLLVALAVVAGIGQGVVRVAQLAAHGRRRLAAVATRPDLGQVACAVADALHRAGLVSAGSAQVSVEVDSAGEYRCVLRDVPEAEGLVFVTALEEVVSPLDLPRYVVPRWVALGEPGLRQALDASRGRLRASGEVWHAVPTVLGVNAERARAFATAWDHWVGGGDPVYTGSPEGAGVLAAQQGTDPFDLTAVMRRHWH